MVHLSRELPPPKIVLAIFAGVAAVQIPVDLIIGGISPAWSVIVNEVLVILAAPLLILWLSGYRPIAILHVERTGKRRVLVAACLALGSAVLISYLQSASHELVPIPAWLLARQGHPMEANSWQDLYAKLLLLCAVAPICEEVLFRGIIQPALAARWGTSAAIATTAVFFALLHSGSFDVHLYLILGFVFSWIFAVTRSLRTVILCHALNNAWVLANRLHGTSFPLETPMGLQDAMLIASSALIVAAAAAWLARGGRSRRA